MRKKALEILAYLDFTSLNINDGVKSIADFLSNLDDLKSRSLFPAGVCTYPIHCNQVNKYLVDTNVKTIAVGCGFPDSQSLLESKLCEAEKLNDLDLDEVDIVLNHNHFSVGDHESALDEIKAIRALLPNKKLKVILETSRIENEKKLKQACTIAILGGADFVKTSTGKNGDGAKADSFQIIAETIADYQQENNRKIGIKASGGIKTVNDAWVFRNIVLDVLGEDYLNPNYFRIGASSLLKDIKKHIEA